VAGSKTSVHSGAGAVYSARVSLGRLQHVQLPGGGLRAGLLDGAALAVVPDYSYTAAAGELRHRLEY
jgi:hypothetical protein